MRTDVDVLVVGAGVAGLSTALGIAGVHSVLVVSAGDGSTPWAQGGIAVAGSADDDPADHAQDTAAAGVGLCDAQPLSVLVEEGPSRVAELIAAGAQLDRTPDGSFSRTLEGGHHRRRVVHAGGDATGAEVARTLRAAAEAAGVETIEPSTVVDLLLAADGAVCGAVLDIGGHLEEIRARAVVLATGGIGHAYDASTNPAAVTGAGIALALRAGATLVDMEFVQFHPTVLRAPGAAATAQLPLVTEAMRGEGAVLRDAHGTLIMAGRHPMADLAPRDIVARAIDETMRRDGTDAVWLDATRLPVDLLEQRFPTVLASCRAVGIEPALQSIPVAPAEHFLCGGVRTDRWGSTDVAGLYAVGETAATGVHGANRLASNSLLEGLVFGRRVAARLVLDLPRASAPERRLPDPVGLRPGAAGEIRRLLATHAGVRRRGRGLATAAAALDAMRSGASTLDSPLWTVAAAVVAAAGARTESRGCHWRSDYPATSERWARRVSVVLDPAGTPVATLDLAEAAA